MSREKTEKLVASVTTNSDSPQIDIVEGIDNKRDDDIITFDVYDVEF